MAERLETMLVSFGSRPRCEQVGRLEVRVVSNWIPRGRFTVDPVNPFFLRHLRPADIIHYHQPHTSMANVAVAYATATRKPIFSTPLGGGGLAFNLTRAYAGHLHISDFSRRVYGQAALPSARTILGGVDTKTFTPDPTVRQTGEVLFVGRLLPHKGINYLIEGVDAATPLTIVGRRWWRRHRRFYELLRTLARTKNVTFQENCDDRALVDAYRRALCVVLPSVYVTVFGEQYRVPELLGQTLLEAMACGTPAICTAVGGMPEVVEHGVTGFVVPPNDPAALADRVRWLQNNPDERARMSEASRQRVLTLFTWDRVVARCVDAYRAA